MLDKKDRQIYKLKKVAGKRETEPEIEREREREREITLKKMIFQASSGHELIN